MFYVLIFVSGIAVQERSPVSHQHQIVSKTFQEIKSPGNASILTKSYQPFLFLVSDQLIVDQTNIFFNESLVKGHITMKGLC